jgi:hypothetical protein
MLAAGQKRQGEVMKHKSRSVVLGQVGLSIRSRTQLHLIDDELLIDLSVEGLVGFVALEHANSSMRGSLEREFSSMKQDIRVLPVGGLATGMLRFCF